jgi:hypothetical protein
MKNACTLFSSLTFSIFSHTLFGKLSIDYLRQYYTLRGWKDYFYANKDS